jgi:hypothetical protein
MVDTRNAPKILIGKPEGKRPFGRWENKIREIGWERVDWVLGASGGLL